MPTPPTYTRSWYDVGGQQDVGIERFWTWAQARVVVQLTGVAPNFSFGFGSHNEEYPATVGFGGADLTFRTFRGIPLGVDGTFNQVQQPPPSTDINWYFFWGGFYEVPPDSGIYVQGIGAGVDQDDLGGILDNAVVVCQNATFTTNSSARNPAGLGQFIASYPAGDPGPGDFVSVTTA